MPKGNPTAQTKASEKYQKKVGMVAKAFKLNGDLANDFKAACEKAGVSQASVISGFMEEFIKKNQ